jgi:two-component system, NtrC family, sensor kinase
MHLVPTRPRRWLIWLIVASLIVPPAFFGLVAYQTRLAVFSVADQEISGTVRLLREHAQKVLDTDELAIEQVDRLTTGMSWGEIAHSETLHRELKRLDDQLPQIRGIFLIAPDGTVASSSRAFPASHGNALDRDFFPAIRDGYAGTFISKIYPGRTSGQLQFNVARRRTSRDGRFDGVVDISDSPAYFEEAYQKIGDRTASVVLARADGEILASYPMQLFAGSPIPADLVSRVVAQEPLLVPSITTWDDGTDRRGGFQRLDGRELLVGYSIPNSTINARWLRSVVPNGALVLCGSLTIALISWLALQGFQREAAAHAAFRDEVEKRERAEARMEQAKRMEAIGQLTAGVAHDFNNLLTIVSVNLEALARGAEPTQAAKLEVALSATMRGANLIRQMLTLARRQDVCPETIDVNHVLRDLSPLLGSMLKGNVSLEYHLTPGPAFCWIDRSEFELAVLNIVANARHAMPHGGSLDIDTETVQIAGDGADDLHQVAGPYLRIACTDSGSGMSPEVMARAFEAFFTTRETAEGTGLGLSQVYGFARQSGGTATVQSSLDEGTTVIIYLPIAAAPEHVAGDQTIGVLS